jgi:glycosyltransferase involved in cell wall biosynthesis
MPKVSIIIPNFNRAEYIGACLRSCLSQTEKSEIIVVDDASTDNSKIILDSFGKDIKAIYLPENKGQAYACNEGIKIAQGQYIYRLDSDDYITNITTEYLSKILDENKDIGFVYGDHILVDKNDNFIERVNLNNIDELFSHGAGIMFRKSYLEKIGLYDAEMRHADDYDLLKRYLKNFDGYHLRMPFYRYRQSDKSITRLNKRDEYIQKSDAKDNS